MMILWYFNRMCITISRVIIYGMSYDNIIYIYNYIWDYSKKLSMEDPYMRFPEMVNRPSHGLPF